MNRVTVYRIPEEDIKLYYNVIGFYGENEDIGEVSTQFTGLEQLYPSRPGDIPPYNHDVDFYMKRFLEKLCTRFSNTPAGIKERDAYQRSYMGILGLATNLKLVDNGDKELEFQRQSYLMSELMKHLNNMSILDVISFYKLFNQESFEIIKKCESKYPELVKLSLLGLIDNPYLDTTHIFDGDNKIDYDKVDKIIKNNSQTKLDYKRATYKYRTAYKEVCS